MAEGGAMGAGAIGALGGMLEEESGVMTCCAFYLAGVPVSSLNARELLL